MTQQQTEPPFPHVIAAKTTVYKRLAFITVPPSDQVINRLTWQSWLSQINCSKEFFHSRLRSNRRPSAAVWEFTMTTSGRRYDVDISSINACTMQQYWLPTGHKNH